MGKKAGRNKARQPHRSTEHHADPAKPQPALPTPSAVVRDKGNRLFKSLDTALSADVIEAKLQQVVEVYKEAASCAASDEDRASAWKNVASCWVKVQQHSAYKERALNACVWAAQAGLRAQAFGCHCKPQAWLEATETSVVSNMDIARDIRSTLPVDQQLSWLGKLLRAVDADGSGIKANIAFGSATQILHLGVRALEAEDYKLGLKCVYEAQNPLEIGRQLAGGSSDLLQQHAELQEDLWRHECICQSVLARQRGENLLAASLADSESLDMDSIWLVVDAYKDAAILSREMDIENEATAFSRLGMLYHDVLKVEAKATACLKQSYMLAGSLYPVPYHASWYQDVVKTMAKMQQARAKRADEELQKLRAPFLEELKDELADISKACDTGPERLLDHIYKAHPPQDPSNKQPVWSPDGAKDALKTAIAHYSSDLAQNRHEVNTGTVLQEEIRKALTAKYFIFSPAC